MTVAVKTTKNKTFENFLANPTTESHDKGKLLVQSIGKSYKKQSILRDVSLQVQKGQAVGLLGANGAGKTTSFYIITGLIEPDSGVISIDGTDVTKWPMYRRAKKGIGYLAQEPSIFRGLSVEDNILAVLEKAYVSKDERMRHLENLLNDFSIGHLRRQPSVSLSGGERRRLEIARVLANNPSYILLDEPLAGVDPIAIAEIRTLIEALKNRNIGVLITDHNVRETLNIVDMAYILHDGQVLMSGTPKEIIQSEAVRGVYLGDSFNLEI